jgi:transposase
MHICDRRLFVDMLMSILHSLECEHYGEKSRAKLPLGVSKKSYGARLTALVGMLSVEARQSHRQMQGLLREVFGIEISRGTIIGSSQN